MISLPTLSYPGVTSDKSDNIAVHTTFIVRAQDVLKQVDAMRQYQEDVENLNEVAHNRPRAQLVLGIQQENRHIRTLQQENKELRAALEEHQNALELIMSKYRNHVTRLVNTPKPDLQAINNEQLHILAEKTEKVCEMAAVMKEAVRVDEENCNLQQEVMARLVTENKVSNGNWMIIWNSD